MQNILPRSRVGWFGLGLVVTMGVLVAVASDMPPPQFEPVGARSLALALPLALLLVGILLVLQDFRSVDEDDQQHAAIESILKPAALYAMILGYIFLVVSGLDRIVYVAVSAVFAGITGWMIGGYDKRTIAVIALIVGGLISVGIIWSFSTFLYVDIAG